MRRHHRQPPIRLLILAVFITTTCNAWSLFGFSDEQSQPLVSLHPLSPAEADPTTLRVKRQAYQVNIDGDVSVTVDQAGGGHIESGAWGSWHREGDCSRPCGGGVYKEKRECNGECAGPSVRYLSCNLDECPEDSEDFRANQCAAHNDDPLDGKYYKWVPYAGANKCELTCKPDTENFYYKWADKVVDGTKCDQLNNDICVDGICLPLGCDGKLGSTSKADKCGVCNGNGTSCKSQEGVIKESSLSSGYNNIITLPVGATSIKIEENRPTSNSLAIKNESGHYYLNGNHQILLADQDVVAGGTVFKYQKAKSDAAVAEQLTASGPLKEELSIQLLFQRAPHGSAVKYSFSTPLDESVQYVYKPGEWSQCSVTCGKGVQTRSAFCTDTENQQQRVEDALCDDNNATKPQLEKSCQTVDCAAEWFVGSWEECSESCGDHGWQYRVIYCHKVFANGKRMTVDDENCTSVDRPAVKQTCNRYSCPEWHAGPWSACSEKCGDAKQYRSVTCRSEREGEEGKLLPASDCPADVEMESERHCNLGPCEGLTFQTTDWNLCERCNDTEETRNVTCKDETGRAYPLEKCLTNETTEIPSDTRACATQPPCEYEWHVSEWSKCSTECGHGHKTRKVHCAINELGSIKILDETLCNEEKPPTKENCTNEEKCTGTYYTGPWSNCTAECGGGTQTRLIACLNYDKVPVPEWCDESERPQNEQECNTDPCPTCHDSDFGCCPDNTTFAQGDWLEGCSNCTVSEFGCCADNFTEAQGPDFYGCDEYVETTPGSGEEPTEATTTGGGDTASEDDQEECEVTNEETGEVAKLLCSDVNGTRDAEVEQLLLGGDNETDSTTAENQTIHCSKTEFGCCPDWYTPAEGKKFAGCPSFVLGACNETQNGCCPDNVTLARGANLEGCGEPSCAASLFGCCKDRKTIAFGPHYAGCERSSFPCELSEFGCCEDGETAALGKNGTGCGSSCLVSKFGCCPDGKTTAKGANNEGCGCQFSQFGCCSDGKTPAKGAGFYGCPETCAQSRYGCCPDGKTAAQGSNKEGCPCQYTRWGCCQDGQTIAMGPNKEGCDDCRHAKHGCCPDGESKAYGPQFQGCPTTTPAAFIIGGTVAPQRIIACNLPQDKGDVCHAGYQLAWFYDTTEGRCSQFWYGGCGGNDNRYSTKEECEAVCVEPPETGRCYLPKVEGPVRCTNMVARYWYDYTTKQCAAFWWRGCLGNANNFESWEQCQSFCRGIGPFEEPAPQIATIPPYIPVDTRRIQPDVRYQPQPHQPVTPAVEPLSAWPSGKSPEVCNLGKDVGRCTGHFNRYYYDRDVGTCEIFQYSGCGGNQNRFNTREQCEDVCLRTVSQPQLPAIGNEPVAAAAEIASAPSNGGGGRDDRCEGPKDHGPCSNFVLKWWFNKEDGTCTKFYYGGCEGNANLHNTEQDCKSICANYVDVCQLPAVKGPCEGNRQRWHYNRDQQQCQEFMFGGCLGNENNFHTKEACEQRCPPASS